MYRAMDIANVFETIAPMETGIPGDGLGFIYGDPTTEITGLACVWDVHALSLQTCIEKKANMIICHEGIWMPEQTSPWYDGPGPDAIHSNRIRKQWLDDHHMVVYRSHSNWDALAQDGVPDQAVLALNLIGLEVVARQKFFSVHALPQPMPVASLCEQVKRGLAYPTCRLFGDGQKSVSKFAFLIGGFGENQCHMPQAARDMGAEAIIIGEMSEWIVIASLEMGMPVIESLHSVSEIPAIKRQAQLLAKRLDDLPVHYVPSGATAFAQNP